MSTYYIEIRAGVRRSGGPNLVPLQDAHKYIGFRSVFAYDDTIAEVIRLQGNTSNLRGKPVYADTIFTDFDNHDPVEFREWLRASGIAHTEWDSGNRSVHFHVQIQPVYGEWVPHACKAWTLQHAPTADISFLHPAGQYRLPGTFHPKRPGRRKLMTYQQEGQPLVLEEPPKREFKIALHDDTTIVDFYTLLLVPKLEGGRQPYIWRLAITAAQAGMEFAETLEHLHWWNSRFCTPMHQDSILQRQCESAYKQAMNGSRRG